MTWNLTSDLASFAAETVYDDLPERTRERAKIVLLDAIACALTGWQSDDSHRMERTAVAIAGPGLSPVIGHTPLSPTGAVLVNGYLVTATTMCDVYLPTLCHVTPEVLPICMAVGTERKASGASLLLSFALGLELTTRISLGANYAAFRGRGWHSPGVFGPLGGAAAAGKLMGLDAAGLVNAIGIAGSQAAGTFAHWGTPTVKLHQARGALSGYLAAELADAGFRSSPDVLTMEDGGIYSAYSDGGDPAAALANLGADWRLEDISLRQWPLASSLQGLATSLFALLGQENIAAGEVAQVRIGLSETSYKMHGTLPWDTRFQALLSGRYVASVIIHDRECWLDQFTPARIADPALTAFASERVVIEPDPAISASGARVEIKFADGHVMSDVRANAHGEPTDPLTMADVTAKFLRAAEPVLGVEAARRTMARLAQIDELECVDDELFGCPGV